jgi:beta-glucosidase
LVVSDWNAVKETISWGYAKDDADAARVSICAGNDMDMLSTAYYRTIAKQVKDGTIPIEVVDEAVRRVLRVKFMVGLFERPYADESAYESAILRPEHIEFARECVAKSTVLLKNDGVLPVSKTVRKIALIGPFGDDQSEMLGCWQGFGEAKDAVTLAKGLRDKFGSKISLTVVKGCSVQTQPRMKTLQDGSTVVDESAGKDDDAVNLSEAVRAAKAAELVIMAVGEPRGITGEGGSRATLTITGRQQELLDAVAAAGKPVVTVVFSGRPLSIPAVFEKSSAVLFAWQPGIEAGNGLADLLSGDVAPSARLSISVPYEVGQVPLYYNHYVTGRRTGGVYRDGVPTAARFWFGYGLTYTRFEYGGFKIVPAKNGKSAEAVATIRNSGRRKGVETVQLYIRQLACNEGARPMQELRGFKRIALKPGESAEVRFPLTKEVLGYVDRTGGARVDKGDYHVWITPNARCGEPMTFTHK